METTTTKKARTITSYLLFALGEEVYTFNVRYVLNILEMRNITQVPNTPSYVKGIINLRGNILPIVDLRQKLNMTPIKVTSNTCILVLEIPQNADTFYVGAMVDQVKGVVEFQPEQIKSPPEMDEAENKLITGVLEEEDQLILLPDIHKLFTQNELNVIQDINQNS